MMNKGTFLAAALIALANAQEYNYIPDSITGSFCDGSSRPDWKECQDNFVDWVTSKDLEIGPGFLEGTVFKGEKCSIRYVECGRQGSGWTQEEEGNLFNFLADECASDGIGGTRRQANLCVIVEDPSNRFEPNLGPDSRVAARAVENNSRKHARDLGVSTSVPRDTTKSLTRRAECSGDGQCYNYVQTNWAVNLRGVEQKVCENILPDGASCTNTRTVTITDTWTMSGDVTAGIKDIVEVTVGFSKSNSEAVATALATDLKIDCPGGSGYVVWYPLEERSRGYIEEGTCNAGWCGNLGERVDLEVRKPILKEDNPLTGEYAVKCI